MTWDRSSGASDLRVVQDRANSMRKDLTEAERRLCWMLRHDLRFEGTHFRKQVPIGRYIVDFASFAAKLIVEVDGEQHGYAKHQAYDATRNAYLESNGFRVLRFWNGEVFRERSTVIDTIFAVMQERISAGDLS